MSTNTNDPKRTMEVLSDMFRNITPENLRAVCEVNDWNLEMCISTLLEAEDDDDSVGFQKVHYARGAVPKSISLLNLKENNNVRRNYRTHSNNNDNNATLSPRELKINAEIKAGYRIMIIMRGAPGSGKTFLANNLIRNNVSLDGMYELSDFIFSTDDFFYNSNGQYKYNVLQLNEAHNYNQKRVREKAKNGWSPIIVDNTNMQLWEMLPYVQIAVENNYLIEILEPNTPWQRLASRLAALNRHGVPLIKIKQMLEKYEEGTIHDVLKMLKDTKYTAPLPQMRLQPQPSASREPSFLIPPLSSHACISTSQHDKVNNEKTYSPYSNNVHTLSKQYCNVKNNNKYEYEPKEQRSKSVPTQQRYQNNQRQNVEVSKSLYNTKDINVDETKECLEREHVDDNKIVQIPKTTVKEKLDLKKDENTLLDLLKEDTPLRLQQHQQKQEEEKQNNTVNNSNLQRHSTDCPFENDLFKSLRQIYPNKPVSGLWDLFVKCNGSLDWAVDILMKEDELLWVNSDSNTNCKYNNYVKYNDDKEEALFDNYKCTCQESVEVSLPLITLMPESKTTKKHCVEKPLPQRHRSRSSRSSRSSQQQQQSKNADLIDLKQSIEKCFILGDEQYSNHILKIKNAKAAANMASTYGPNSSTQFTTTAIENEMVYVSDAINDYSIVKDIVDEIVQKGVHHTSIVNSPLQQDAIQNVDSTELSNTTEYTYIHDIGKCNKQDDDVNKEELENGVCNEEEEEEDNGEDCDIEEPDNEEMLELPISEQTLKELFLYFKDDASPILLQNMKIKLPDKLFVLMSKTVAKHLYMLCMESLYSFMAEERHNMIQADENFARLLKYPKYEDCKQLPDNVEELLNVEMALNTYNEGKAKELRLPKCNQGKDLATYLTEMKLLDIFPNIPQDTILNVYTACKNSYDDTVAALQRINILPNDKKALNENYNNNNTNSNNNDDEKSNCIRPLNSVLQSLSPSRPPIEMAIHDPRDINDDNAKESALHQFEEMRNLAAHHHQLKSECYRKGQEAIMRKQGLIASYYSDIAEMHKKKIDRYNQIAANCIREVHKYTQNQDHLDLHYLYVPEALESLDIFLDHHITNLRITSEKTKDVYVITGRGRHSATGISTIKTKVMTRLKERNLKYKKENAGLLKVKIYAASRHSKSFV